MYLIERFVIEFSGLAFDLAILVVISKRGVFKFREWISYPGVVGFDFYIIFFPYLFSSLMMMICPVI